MSKIDSDDIIQSTSSSEIMKEQTTKKRVIGITASSDMTFAEKKIRSVEKYCPTCGRSGK